MTFDQAMFEIREYLRCEDILKNYIELFTIEKDGLYFSFQNWTDFETKIGWKHIELRNTKSFLNVFLPLGECVLKTENGQVKLACNSTHTSKDIALFLYISDKPKKKKTEMSDFSYDMPSAFDVVKTIFL